MDFFVDGNMSHEGYHHILLYIIPLHKIWRINLTLCSLLQGWKYWTQLPFADRSAVMGVLEISVVCGHPKTTMLL